MRDRAEKLLDDMRQQETYLVEQLAMTRGAIQALEHLLSLDDGTKADVPDDKKDPEPG